MKWLDLKEHIPPDDVEVFISILDKSLGSIKYWFTTARFLNGKCFCEVVEDQDMVTHFCIPDPIDIKE